MSTLLYGAVTAQRRATESGESKNEKAPGLGTYVDTVAALVPAEILAANAALLPIMSSTAEVNGEPVTTITDPGTLKVVFWLSIVFSIFLFVVADRSRAKKAAAKDGKPVAGWSRWDCLRALIPAGSYVAWVMLQPSTSFDAIAPSMEEALRLTLAVFGAIALGVIAKGLGDKADNADPPA